MIHFYALAKKGDVLVATMEDYEKVKHLNKKLTEKRYNKLIFELTLLYSDLYKVKCINTDTTFEDEAYEIIDDMRKSLE